MRIWASTFVLACALAAPGGCSSSATGPSSTSPTVASGCGMESCGDTCTDPGNCGGCGDVCVTGATCNDGVCACPPGNTVCNGACVDGAKPCAPAPQDDSGLPEEPDGAPLHDAGATDGTTTHADASMTCDPASAFSCGTLQCEVPGQICVENLYDAGHGPTYGCATAPASCGCATTCGCVETSSPYELYPGLTCNMTSSGAVTVTIDVQGIKP